MYNITVDGQPAIIGQVEHLLMAIPFELDPNGHAFIEAPLLALLYDHPIDGQRLRPNLNPAPYQSIKLTAHAGNANAATIGINLPISLQVTCRDTADAVRRLFVGEAGVAGAATPPNGWVTVNNPARNPLVAARAAEQDPLPRLDFRAQFDEKDAVAQWQHEWEEQSGAGTALRTTGPLVQTPLLATILAHGNVAGGIAAQSALPALTLTRTPLAGSQGGMAAPRTGFAAPRTVTVFQNWVPGGGQGAVPNVPGIVLVSAGVFKQVGRDLAEAGELRHALDTRQDTLKKWQQWLHQWLRTVGPAELHRHGGWGDPQETLCIFDIDRFAGPPKPQGYHG